MSIENQQNEKGRADTARPKKRLFVTLIYISTFHPSDLDSLLIGLLSDDFKETQ
jgi:hypothetical protein